LLLVVVVVVVVVVTADPEAVAAGVGFVVGVELAKLSTMDVAIESWLRSCRVSLALLSIVASTASLAKLSVSAVLCGGVLKLPTLTPLLILICEPRKRPIPTARSIVLLVVVVTTLLLLLAVVVVESRNFSEAQK